MKQNTKKINKEREREREKRASTFDFLIHFLFQHIQNL